MRPDPDVVTSKSPVVSTGSPSQHLQNHPTLREHGDTPDTPLTRPTQASSSPYRYFFGLPRSIAGPGAAEYDSDGCAAMIWVSYAPAWWRRWWSAARRRLSYVWRWPPASPRAGGCSPAAHCPGWPPRPAAAAPSPRAPRRSCPAPAPHSTKPPPTCSSPPDFTRFNSTPHLSAACFFVFPG